MMIYLDNAASSWPKPPAVVEAMRNFTEHWAANPGRAAHRMAVEAEAVVSRARSLLADLLHAPSPSRLVFTLNGTDALNMALKGFLRDGDHVVTSSIEHNSVARPLTGLELAGRIRVTRVDPREHLTIHPMDIRDACTDKTRLVVVTACSNVFGIANNVDLLAKAAHERSAAILVDAAQAVGVMDFDVSASSLDMVAFPCHKGLFGPMGTGALYVRPGIELSPWREGGTGTHSESERHPDEMPCRLEGGTPNTHGLAGLTAGLTFLRETGIARVREHERLLSLTLMHRLESAPGVKLLNGWQSHALTGIVLLNIDGIGSQEAAAVLDSRYGIAVRAGLHCAPGAHRFLGTFPDGALRFSFGFFNTQEEAEQAARAVMELAGAVAKGGK